MRAISACARCRCEPADDKPTPDDASGVWSGLWPEEWMCARRGGVDASPLGWFQSTMMSDVGCGRVSALPAYLHRAAAGRVAAAG